MILDKRAFVLTPPIPCSTHTNPAKPHQFVCMYYHEEGHRSPKVLGKYYSHSTGVLSMATSESLPQRPMRKSQRLWGQEPQQVTQEKVFRSAATPSSSTVIECKPSISNTYPLSQVIEWHTLFSNTYPLSQVYTPYFGTHIYPLSKVIECIPSISEHIPPITTDRMHTSYFRTHTPSQNVYSLFQNTYPLSQVIEYWVSSPPCGPPSHN